MNDTTAGPAPRAIFSGPVTTPVLPAATVVVLRDGEQGLEVLMLRRHAKSDVLGGAFVFPGGKLDPVDRAVVGSRCVDAAPERLRARLGEAQLDAREAAALFVAACRETLEESGVLFAHDADAACERTRSRRNPSTPYWARSRCAWIPNRWCRGRAGSRLGCRR